MSKKVRRHPGKFVIQDGDGEFFKSNGDILSREELVRRRKVRQGKKKDWELEMSLRREEMSGRRPT